MHEKLDNFVQFHETSNSWRHKIEEKWWFSFYQDTENEVRNSALFVHQMKFFSLEAIFGWENPVVPEFIKENKMSENMLQVQLSSLAPKIYC